MMQLNILGSNLFPQTKFLSEIFSQNKVHDLYFEVLIRIHKGIETIHFPKWNTSVKFLFTKKPQTGAGFNFPEHVVSTIQCSLLQKSIHHGEH